MASAAPYDAAAHGATGTATGVGGVDLSAELNLGATFTDVPGGTANWTFTGGTNYNDQSGDAAIIISKADATSPSMATPAPTTQRHMAPPARQPVSAV